MRAGVALFAQNYTDWDRYEERRWDEDPAISDTQIYAEEVRLGNLVEPLGYDSMWTVEHHFTPYTMNTNTLQFLTYFAGLTTRIDFGTMVIVLPWHHPVRVAESAAMLDQFLGGRRLSLGFGRGAAKVEFDGLGVEMDSSRERFLETLDVVRKALSSKHFSHEGKYFSIPDLAIRPHPRSDLTANMHMAWGSPSSVAVAADNDLLPLVIPQKEWATHVAEMQEYNRIRAGHGSEPARPVVLLAVYVDEDPVRAEELGRKYATEYADSARRHYKFDDPTHLADVKGYEYYNDTAAKFADANPEKLQAMEQMREAARTMDLQSKSTEDLMSVFIDSHLWGTPDQVLELLKDRLQGVGASEFVGVFKYGSMPYDQAERSLRLFSERILPELHAMATPDAVLPETAGA
jgi:alkanesulfonate monooxygenase SsuD/methylene tetrahydromethanopterin reductase-like flavin-dependent oxidoreductase (luciferase family)